MTETLLLALAFGLPLGALLDRARRAYARQTRRARLAEAEAADAPVLGAWRDYVACVDRRQIVPFTPVHRAAALRERAEMREAQRHGRPVRRPLYA